VRDSGAGTRCTSPQAWRAQFSFASSGWIHQQAVSSGLGILFSPAEWGPPRGHSLPEFATTPWSGLWVLVACSYAMARDERVHIGRHEQDPTAEPNEGDAALINGPCAQRKR